MQYASRTKMKIKRRRINCLVFFYACRASLILPQLCNKQDGQYMCSKSERTNGHNLARRQRASNFTAAAEQAASF